MKQTIATMKTHLLRSTVLLALLFLAIPVAPRALGQEISNVNGMTPHAATAGSLMALVPLNGGCPSTMTQSVSQSIVTGNSAACNLLGSTTQNSYWRAFNMNTFTGGQAYAVTSVSFGIETAQSGSRTGQPVAVNLYVNNGAAFPGGILTLLATTGSVNVPDQGFTIFSVPLVTTVPAGTFELVMEVNSPDGIPDDNRFFIGSNAAGQTGASYLSAPDCGLPSPTDVAALGFPGMDIVFDVSGSCPPLNSLTGLSPAKVWVGLANSDDVGIKFDLQAIVSVNGTAVGSGHLDSVASGSSGFNNARLDEIPLTLSAPVAVSTGDSFSIEVFARNACVGSGKNNGRARLWYNGQPIDTGATRNAGSRFDATIGGTNSDYFLRTGAALSTTDGAARVSTDVQAGPKCGPFVSFGTWSTTLP